MSYQDKILYFQDNREAVRARIYNFDIGKAILKPQHMEFLQSRIVPVLQAGGSLRLIGLASRTGNCGFNRQLSERRRDAVLGFLHGQVRNDFAVARSEAQGENAARLAGVPDCREHENWRSVIVFAWSRPIPPPERIEIPTTPPQLVERIVRRSWSGVPRASFVSDDNQSGDNLTQVSELGLRMTNPNLAEGPQVKRMIRSDFLINSIRLTREAISSRFLGFTMAEMEAYTIEYSWGIPQPFVELQQFRSNTRSRLTRGEAQRWIERPGNMIFRGF